MIPLLPHSCCLSLSYIHILCLGPLEASIIVVELWAELLTLCVTHVYRKENKCANRLTNLENDFKWFHLLPLCVREDFFNICC